MVPGYYHRYNGAGEIERSTCCENTANENRMMGKLMSDFMLRWAREYKVSSFRFDIKCRQPRQARMRSEFGCEVQLLDEGWNAGAGRGRQRCGEARQPEPVRQQRLQAAHQHQP